MNPPQRRTLGLFAKWPRAGQVKTRLAAETSAEWAAQVAMAFLSDTVERLARVSSRRILAFTPPDSLKDFEVVVTDRFIFLQQSDGDLGQRMAAFFAACLTAPDERVVLIGTDSPTLPLAHIEAAFDALSHADVVLCPATDGGYCLIGCTRMVPPIFDGITWGGTTVLAETVGRLSKARVQLTLLPPWYDVDTVEDWQMLRGHVAAMRRAGFDPGVPFTEALLSQSFAKESPPQPPQTWDH